MPPASGLDHGALLALAHRLADVARPIALRHFRSASLSVENKHHAAGFDPVTAADKEIEAAIRAILARDRPDDGILGEEELAKPSHSGLTWVIDPIDGTRAFMCGLPLFGVLIAVSDDTGPLIGIMDQPFTGERFIGSPDRAELARGARPQALATRTCAALSDAILCTTAPELFIGEDAARFDAMRGAVRLARFGTDCYGYAMLAAGQVDLVMECRLKSYDIQAMIPIIRGAGGVITTWSGDDPRNGGRILAAGDPALHAQALALINE